MSRLPLDFPHPWSKVPSVFWENNYTRKHLSAEEIQTESDNDYLRSPQAFDLFSELPQTPLTSHTSQLGQKTREQIKAEEALKKKRLFALGVFIVILGILVALALT